MKEEELTYPATDGVHNIHALIWTADDDTCPVRGILQIAHGMSEYIDRYRDFASFMVDKGFVVCGHDHLGHGASVLNAEELGHISLENGKEAMVENLHSLRLIMEDRYEHAYPYILMGHSMGSFISRAYMASHGEGIAGCILCGTGNPSWLASCFGHVLTLIAAAIQGQTKISKGINTLGVGQFASAIPHARTKLDWLNTDNEAVDAYIADPLCGQTFTIGAWAMMSELTREVVERSCARKVPVDCPILFVSGELDPVGHNGTQVKQAAALYTNAGVQDVTVKLYPGMRHEILNEPEHMKVYQDIEAWLTDRVVNHVA